MMFVFMLFLMFLLILLILMLSMNLLISKKKNKNYDKMSSFECGFDSMSMNRMPFSLQFYLITVIFLIFDVEIALILPMVNLMYMFLYLMIFSLFMIMVILVIGLLLEWNEGALVWFN